MNTQPIECYSVVFSYDRPRHDDYGVPGMKRLNPPPDQLRNWKGRSRLWQLTETEAEEEGQIHRKWAGVLTPDEFHKFVDHVQVYAEDIETAGTIGCPGFGFGWCPAVSFDGSSESVYMNAYVTPVPFWPDERQKVLPFDEEGGKTEQELAAAYWERVRLDTIEKWRDWDPYEEATHDEAHH